MKKQGPFGRSKFLLAGILAAGAIAPGINQPLSPVRSASSPVPAAITRSTGQNENKALPAAQGAQSGQLLGMIGGMGDDGGYAMFGRGGLNRKEWGMSAACARMVRKNRGIARGISAQRL